MTRCWIFLAFCFQAIYALQSHHHKKNPIPWWSSESLSYKDVPGDFDWDNRRTGITDHWTNGLAIWSHYDAEALSNASSSSSSYRGDQHHYPIPWNVGRMLKSLRRFTSDQAGGGQADDSAFELCSLYEPGACGAGFESFMKDRLDFGDNLLQHEHIFHKTSNRVSRTPGTSLPSDDDNDKNTELAAVSQATIVQKDSATFAGGRWLPSSQQAREFLRVASKHSSGDNSNNIKYNHMHIFELWLSEPVRNDQPDGRKIGMFCIYDGMTGELLQFFRMNEVLLEGIEAIDPKMSRIDMDELETSLRLSNNVAWIDSASKLLASKVAASLSSSSPSSSSSLSSSSSSSSSMKEVLSTMGYDRVWGRAVKTVDVPSGSSVATELEPSSSSSHTSTQGYYFPPSNEDDYYQCRFEDGVYMRIPKRLSADMETIGLELGCFTLHGEFHRLLAIGDRTQQKMHTNVYERWSKE